MFGKASENKKVSKYLLFDGYERVADGLTLRAVLRFAGMMLLGLQQCRGGDTS